MKKIYTKLLFLLLAAAPLWAQTQESGFPVLDPESCTSIMVGKKATTDGSTITSHTCDGNYRGWTEIVPASKNEKGATTTIYKGLLKTTGPNDMHNVTISGTIPEAAETYAFFNTAYPSMNEKALTMGETTISGRRELVNKDGMFLIEELQRLALQRTTNARDAIRLMGDLVKEYGYGDWGECLTIADKNEVWHFEIFGEGPKKIGGVWAAVRIPDDHVGVSANIPRISTLDLENKDYYMASENVFDVAKKLGYWDGKSEFVFWKAYGGREKAYSIREFFILDQIAPSLNLTMEPAELPFSVKPEKKLSVIDVIDLQKTYYEGTEYDPTINLTVTTKDREGNETTKVSPYANPWMSRNFAAMMNAQKDGSVKTNRLVSVPQCTYHTVIQVRDWLPEEIGAVAWYGLDNPGQSPRFPIYSGTKSLPKSFSIDGQYEFRRDAAIWAYRRANKLSSIRWGDTRSFIEGGVRRFEEKALSEMPEIEKKAIELLNAGKTEEAKQMITEYVYDFANATQAYWWELGDKFWLMFARGI